MATFPTLTPSTRTYSPGAYPHTAHGVYDGSEVRVRHSNTVLGVRLRLFFPAITTAELLTVIGHYAGQSGRFLPFSIPNDLLSGVTTPADFTPAGHQWRYAAKPTVEDISIVGGTNRHNLTIELETVPPENTIVSGARLRARASLQAGSAQLGKFFDVYAWLDAGAGAAVDPFLVTATLDVGAASSVLTDPYFANVSLLLPMNGTNGSTTFTDASSNNHAITTYGDAQISTARWPFSGSGSSLLLDGTVDKLSLPQALPSSLRLDFGSYTVEAFVYTTSTATQAILGNLDNQTGNGHYWMVINSTFNGLHTVQWFGPNNAIYQWGSTTLATNQWHHIAATYNGISTRVFLNGTLLTAGSNSGASNRNNNVPFYIGASHNVGSLNYTLGGSTIYGLIGNISNVRITKGVARYTTNFTSPTAAFPTS